MKFLDNLDYGGANIGYTHHSISGMPWPKPGGHNHVIGLRRVGSKSDIFITFFHVLLEATTGFNKKNGPPLTNFPIFDHFVSIF